MRFVVAKVHQAEGIFLENNNFVSMSLGNNVNCFSYFLSLVGDMIFPCKIFINQHT